MIDEKKPKRVKKVPAVKPLSVDVPRSPEQDRMALKRKVAIFYDLQRLRMQTAGRTYKRPDGTEVQLHEVDLAILEMRAEGLAKAEKEALADVADHLQTIPFYRDVLSDKKRFKGIGPTMAGVILSSFDIVREDTASKMWSFAGLAPVPAKRCMKCHGTVTMSKEDAYLYHHDSSTTALKSRCAANVHASATYDSGKTMKPKKGEKLPYNAFLKTRLVGVLAPVLLKLGSPYRSYYDDYKNRKASAGWGTSDAHRHRAAMRYMIKMLLLDIWKDWRAYLNLPVRPSYHEEKLGHVHSGRPVGATAPEASPEGEGHSFDAEIEAELALAEAV